MKRILITTMLILLITITFSELANAKVELDKNICNDILKQTGVDVRNFTDLLEISQIVDLKLNTWVKGFGGLHDNDFPSAEKKNEIKNTLSLKMTLRYMDGLVCTLKIAKFKNYNDSKLAWCDSSPRLPQPHQVFSTKLFSGESIPNSEIKILAPECECYSNAYIFYKNWLCILSFVTGERKIQPQNTFDFINKSDHKKIDELIKKIINIIDKIN